MTLKNDAKFKEKRTCGFKYDMRNLVNFHSKIWKFLLWWAVFVQGICTRFELQKYRGVIFHDTAQWCKIWINLDFAVSKMAGGIGWNFIRALKRPKNCTLMGSFCPKHIMFQQKNSIGIMCHDTERWCKI